MGCYRFSAEQRAEDKFTFNATLMCDVIADRIEGYIFGLDNRALMGKDGLYFACKDQIEDD